MLSLKVAVRLYEAEATVVIANIAAWTSARYAPTRYRTTEDAQASKPTQTTSSSSTFSSSFTTSAFFFLGVAFFLGLPSASPSAPFSPSTTSFFLRGVAFFLGLPSPSSPSAVSALPLRFLGVLGLSSSPPPRASPFLIFSMSSLCFSFRR
jgi:hypothetical protein